MGNGVRAIVVAAFALAVVPTLSLAATVDPGHFTNGTVLNSAYPDVTLTQWLTDIVVTDGEVTTVIPFAPYSDRNVYAYDGQFSSAPVYGQWAGTTNSLRIDLLQGASSVTQNFFGGVGFVQARAADDSVIATITGGTANLAWYSLTLSSITSPISYLFVSGGTKGYYAPVILGLTQYSPAAPVPAPDTAWLLLSGLAGLGIMGRRRRR